VSRDGIPFHVELARRIARLIREEGIEVGERLNEKRLADLLGVSRTPVRAALAHLAQGGFVDHQQRRGFELVSMPPAQILESEPSRDDSLIARIASDRREGILPDQVSEQDLMRVYQVTRAIVKMALTRLAEVGVVERKLGYRWTFNDDAYDAEARLDIFRFRILVEPSAILEPGYDLPVEWGREMVVRHNEFLEARWTPATSVAFFEMNAAFHEGVVKASGNRFFHESVQRLNRLRRLSNYDWKHGRERVDASCREHLQILEWLLAGDVGVAALLMRQHLEQARRVRSRLQFASF
jgi:DNA-binding GntR family transcriptional regulator